MTSTTTWTYQQSLTTLRLTDAQFRTSVAVHEIAHAVTGLALPTLEVLWVELQEHPQAGPYGGTAFHKGVGDRREHAASLLAGAYAQTCWLRGAGVLSYEVERWVEQAGTGDLALIDAQGLGPGDIRSAQEEATRIVASHWNDILSGAEQLLRKGEIRGRRLRNLVR